MNSSDTPVFGAVNSAGTFLWMLPEANSHVSMPSGGESCEEVHKTSDLIWGNSSCSSFEDDICRLS